MQPDRILSAIEEDIVFGVLPPGSRLVEDRLIERFDAKRYVIREVFSKLEDLGLVTRFPHRGALVNELTPKQVREIYAMRELLEVSAGHWTPLPAPSNVIAQMNEIQKEHSKAVTDENFRAVFHLNIAFHRVQYSVCPNDHLVQTIEEFARKAHLIRATKYGDAPHMSRVVEQHWGLIEAMKGTNRQHLVDLIRAHQPGSAEEYIRQYNIRYGHSATGNVRSPYIRPG